MFGKRVVKPKRNENFAYDEDSLRFLSARSSSGSSIYHTSPDSNNLSIENSNANNVTAAESIHNPWFNLVYLNSYLPSHSHSSSSSVRFNVGDTSALAEGSRSLSQSQNTQGVDLSTDDSDLCCGTGKGGRKTSSTRFDFLDHYSIVSVSPTARIDSSEMSQSDVDSGSASKDSGGGCHIIIP